MNCRAPLNLMRKRMRSVSITIFLFFFCLNTSLVLGIDTPSLGIGPMSADSARPLDTPAVPKDAPCRDPKKSPNERAASLLSLMTLDEMIGQMTQVSRDHLKGEENIGLWNLGSVLNGGGSSPKPNRPEAWADMYDSYQRQALGTRLAIPMIYGIDAVHGNNNVWGSTIFPHNIGLGASRNPALVEQIGRITALEMVGLGIDWTFAPCITVPQDPRWGRTYEGYSENTALVSLLGTAAVKGIQGGTSMSATALKESILSCIKHFVGDGGTTNGYDRGNTELSEADLRKKHLAPYIDTIQAGAATVMISYSSWNGTKMHENKYLITDVLKGELGFKGFVVSDWAAVKQLKGDHKEQIIKAINAGLDMVMVPDSYMEFQQDLKIAVAEGQIPLSRIRMLFSAF